MAGRMLESLRLVSDAPRPKSVDVKGWRGKSHPPGKESGFMTAGKQRMDLKAGHGSHRGFSMIELLVVMAIAVVVAALATPAILQTVRTYRVGTAANEVSNILQRTRYEALRSNSAVGCRPVQVSGRWYVYIDLNNNNAMDPTEPRIVLPATVEFLAEADVPSVDSMGLGATRVPAGLIQFDGRGMVNFGGNPPATLLVFFGNRNRPGDGYRAVSLTPTGRTKTWKAAEGTTWTDK